MLGLIHYAALLVLDFSFSLLHQNIFSGHKVGGQYLLEQYERLGARSGPKKKEQQLIKPTIGAISMEPMLSSISAN